MHGRYPNKDRKAWPFGRAFLHRAFKITVRSAAVCVVFSACSSVENRIDKASNVLAQTGFHPDITQTTLFPLYKAIPTNHAFSQQKTLTVVIEGDGLAWINRHTVSENPTPEDPIGLRMATGLEPPAIYLARPCQYVWSDKCHARFWTKDRFSSDIIEAFEQALNKIKLEYRNVDFRIIGYSGGAYIAFNLATKRSDVKSIITVAGVLDPQKWVDYLDVSPLRLPYSQSYLHARTQNISFTHICGLNDDIVPCSLTEEFLSHPYGKTDNHRIIHIEKANHSSIWKDALKILNSQ